MDRWAISGLRRSGNHVLIEWISQNFNVMYHHNDCVPYGEFFRTQSHVRSYPGKGSRKVEVFSFEERTVKDPESFYEENTERFDKFLFVLRDAYNWGASLMVGRGIEDFESSIQIWKRYANFYLKRPDLFMLYDNFVKGSLSGIKDPYVTAFKKEHNLLMSNDRLPLKFPTSNIGKGSSFSKGKFPKNYSTFLTRNEKVKSRYGENTPKSWKSFVSDKSISDLNSKIFGRTNENIYK